MTRIHPHSEIDSPDQIPTKKVDGHTPLDDVSFEAGDSDSNTHSQEFYEPSLCEKFVNILFCR